jgi:hypothetical protein
MEYNVGINNQVAWLFKHSQTTRSVSWNLHNVTDDEYILIIIAGRYHHSLGCREEIDRDVGRRRGKWRMKGGFPVTLFG